MLRSRAYKTETDLRQMCGMIVPGSGMPALRAGDLQLKLSDPSVDPEKDVRIWEEDGRMIGFAVLHWSGGELVFETDGRANSSRAESEILQWAAAALDRHAAARDRHTSVFTSVCEPDDGRISLLEKSGFTREEEYCIYLYYPLDREISAAKLPDGFTVRHLVSEDEVPAYVAAQHNAFFFDNLTGEWRRRVMKMPFYIPELDLVAVAPDGEFCAICLCWLEQPQQKRDASGADDSNVEKKGYIQTIGTHHEFRNMGIGKALFAEALQRLKTLGAAIAIGQTEAGNKQALRLYESFGVRPAYKIYRYFRNSNV